MVDPNYIRTLGKHQSLLEALYDITEPISLSELSARSQKHISNVSRALDELEKRIAPPVVISHREERERGGKDIRLVSLTEAGRKIVGTWISIRETKEQAIPKLKEAPREDVSFLVDKILNAKSKEVEATATDELAHLARTTKLWENPEVWKLLSKVFDKGMNKPEARGGLHIMTNMLHTSNEEGVKNTVANITKKKFYSKLEELFLSKDPGDDPLRYEALNIFNLILTQKEKFELGRRMWEKAIIDISDDKLYGGYIQPFLQMLQKASMEEKKSMRMLLYKLMESEEEYVRKRAKNIHHMIMK